jgi:hypothetical protein
MEKLLRRNPPSAGRNNSVTAVPIFATNIVRVTGNVYTCSTVCTHDHDVYIMAHNTQVHVGLNLQFPASLLRHRESIGEKIIDVQMKMLQEDNDSPAQKLSSFLEPSDYYDTPLDKYLHFIRDVGLIRG